MAAFPSCGHVVCGPMIVHSDEERTVMSSREQREEHADRQHLPRGDHAPRRSAPDERGDERRNERGRTS